MGEGKLTIIFGITIAYILLTTIISISMRKFANTESKFMAGGKNIGSFVIGVLMMSEFIGTGSTMGTAAVAFNKGLSAAWNLITLFIAFVIFSVFMAPKYKMTEEYTISGVIAKKYGNRVALIVSIIMIYALMVVNIAMYVGGAVIIATLLKLSDKTAIYAISAISIIYVVFGGLKSVAYTNLLHAIVKYAGLIITVIVALHFSGGIAKIQAALKPIYFSWKGVGILTIIGWTIANIGAVFSTQYIIQAIAGTSNPAKAKLASGFAGVLIIPIGLMAALIGVAAKFSFPSITGKMAIPEFIFIMNPWLGGIVTAGLMAAILGTVSATVLGSTALLMRDIYIPLIKPKEKHTLTATRVISILIGILPIPFALYMPHILSTIFFARALRTTLAVIAVCMFYLPFFGSEKSVFWGLIITVAATTIWYILKNPLGIDNIYIATLLPLLIMSINYLAIQLFGGIKNVKN
ncbi:MAG: sodium:solute symporter family protein [Thermoplasmata archaeon]